MRQQPSSRAARLAFLIALVALCLPAGAQQSDAKTERKVEPPKHEQKAVEQKAQEQKPEKAARAEVAEPVVDLGEVTYGDNRTHEFVIRNTGNDTLRIHSAKSNCACTVTEFTSEIAPGAEGKVTARFEAELQPGPVAVPVDLISNDPESPKLRLTVKADVRYFIGAVPGYTRYLIVQDFEGDSTLFNLVWPMDGKPMKVTKVESPYDFVEVTFREARPEELNKDAETQQQWKIETRISPKAPVGPLTGNIVVHVDHPTQKVVKLPLHGFVRPMFAVTPTAADWGELTMGAEGYENNLMVKNFAEELVKVTAAETTVKGITATIEEADPGRIYFIKLSYAPDLPKGPFSGLVKIKTESPKKPLIEVRLKGTIL